jgi:NADH:ubiquinone oxidoreductase subunit 6 (subunit J)
MATTALFFIFAGLAIACAISTVYHKNPLYSAISLIGVFIALSCIYVTLAAPFIAAVQILIYAGAIMVLVVFVIMLLNLDEDKPLNRLTLFIRHRRRSGLDFARADVFYFLRRNARAETSGCRTAKPSAKL